ncbi:MAG: cytochrome c oxidase assembly factor 1 family protein [Acidobacteriota bacterium]|nr:cytochrome c oxidase assembly factor 1 family protein [Acidobacteriota bacterium]
MTVTQAPSTSGTFTPPQGSYTLPPGAPAPPQKSGGCLKALAIGCSVIIVLGAAAVVALVIFVFGVIKRSDVYREAYSRAISDPRVVEALGTPIERGWWVLGNVHIDTEGGTANIDFPISGPKGSARVHAAATRENDNWNYSAIVVRLGSGGRIDVLHR